MGIPRRIIQTGKSAQLPALERAVATSLRLLHSDWEYLFFDDAAVDRFVATEFPQHRDVYASFPHRIQRYDFFRYLAVYRHGGFYFDLDVLLSKGVEPLLTAQSVFPFEELTLSRHLRKGGIDWEIGNYAFGAQAGNAFLGLAIENCIRAQMDTSWLRPMMASIPRPFRSDYVVLNSTGPGLLSRTLMEHAEAASSVTILFPEDVRDRNSWHQFGSFGVHLMNGSWRAGGGFLRRRLASRWEAWAKSRVMPESVRLGPKRDLPCRRARWDPADPA